MIIFIAGPMTGLPDYNRATFNTAANEIIKMGHVVLNPAVLPDGLKHEDYMYITLAMLGVADAIFLLYGWQDSNGAREEVVHTIMKGRPIYVNINDIPDPEGNGHGADE